MPHRTPRDKFIARLEKIWHFYHKVIPAPPSRRIFVNESLPEDMLNAKTGHPKYKYPQNKIRTNKYTAWNFVPKDLALQFTNVANSYFLFIIVLGAFQIFGVQSPAMQCVPLVVIVCLSAIKDGVEDFRRAKSDYEMNTSRVHLLVGMHNPNVFIKKPNAYQRFSTWWNLKLWQTGHSVARRLKRKNKHKSERAKLRNERYALEKRHQVLLENGQSASEGESTQKQVPRLTPAAAAASGTDVTDNKDDAAAAAAADALVLPTPLKAVGGGANTSTTTATLADATATTTTTTTTITTNATPTAALDTKDTLAAPTAGARASIDSSVRSFDAASAVSGLGPLAGPVATNATVKMSGSVSKFVPDTVSNPSVKPIGAYRFRNTYWKYINVGDIIRVRADEEVPADCVMLSSSDAKGIAYVETKNLDGETNLKVKDSLHCGRGLKHASDFERAAFELETEQPTKSLYKFHGVMKYKGFSGVDDTVGKEESEAVAYKNVLLRGAILRNVDWALCVVFATGRETKIMLNSGRTPSKKSRLSTNLNVYVFINFGILFVMCFVAGLVNGLFYHKQHTSRVYFEMKPYAGWSAAANGAVDFFVNLILYQTLVPISLYITIEIIKCLQAFFIYSDVSMYYDRLDFPCTPKSWSISDDLGQIEYVFSDKTGTLTQNVMQFKKCTVDGKQYGLTYTDAQQGLDKRMGVDVGVKLEKMKQEISEDRENMLAELGKHHNNQFVPENLTFISSEYAKDLFGQDKTRQRHNAEFMLALAVCHNVMTSKDKDGYIQYKAESPDEAALVSVARDFGITFCERGRDGQIISLFGGPPRSFRILQSIPFNSTRKRMSVICRKPDGGIVLYCKGADNMIYERLSEKDNSREMASKTAIHLGEFAEEGLRTLCVAKRDVSEQEFQEWHAKYKKATQAIDDDRELQMERVGEEIETDLVLLGGTAIEDRLQTGVPSAIAMTREAGIKLWVLTGDKVETAISIGFSCNLLTTEMELLVIKGSADDSDEDANKGSEEAEKLVEQFLKEKFGMTGSQEELIEAREDHSIPKSNCAVVVDGASLGDIMKDEKCKIQFLLLCKQCTSVLCCRVSPAQKAEIVDMVKTNLNVMTLAIGDGANDVSMIQTANVGVGIAGEEGRQAVMSSDYAIGQFRYLIRLLLVHGRWSYRRLAEMIPCFFYKNIVYVFPLFWYGIFVDYDGTYLYEYTYLMLFNLFFTSMPVIMMGALDQDVPASVSMAVPQLYRIGILGRLCTVPKFLFYMFDGLCQSVICFFFPWLLHHNGVFANSKGLMLDHRFWMGVFCAHIAIFSCNSYVLFRQYRWDWLTVLLWFLSIMFIFVWSGLWTLAPGNSEAFYKSAPECYGSATFWASLACGYLLCMLPRVIGDVIVQYMKPSDVDLVREQVRLGKFKSLPDDYDPTSDEYAEMAARKSMEAGDEESYIESSGSVKKGLFSKAGRKQRRAGKEARQVSGIAALQRIKTEMELEGQSSHRSSLEGIRTTNKSVGVSSAAGLMKVYSRKSFASHKGDISSKLDEKKQKEEEEAAPSTGDNKILEKPAATAQLSESSTEQAGNTLGLSNNLMQDFSKRSCENFDVGDKSAQELAAEDAGIEIQDNVDDGEDAFSGDNNAADGGNENETIDSQPLSDEDNRDISNDDPHEEAEQGATFMHKWHDAQVDVSQRKEDVADDIAESLHSLQNQEKIKENEIEMDKEMLKSKEEALKLKLKQTIKGKEEENKK